MTTSLLSADRGVGSGEFTISSDGPLGGLDVRVIALKVLSRDEVLIELERARQRLLKIDIPRV